MRQWRLIYDPPTTGQRNMAVDEAVLQAVSAGDAAPTLRLYAWTPPCLSLGRGQKSDDIDFQGVKDLGWDVVRRPTGGRAILHADELTYSVALPADDPLAEGGILDSYRRISTALRAGLVRLGLQSEAAKRTERGDQRSPMCFETPSHYEITVGGRKLIGSAQVRRRAGLLQHGTLPLFGDVGRICEALIYPDEAAREAAKMLIRSKATTLAESGIYVSWQQAAEAMVEGFAETFAITFTVSSVSEAETQAAAQMIADGYGEPQAH